MDFIDTRVVNYIQKEKLEKARQQHLLELARPSLKSELAKTLKIWAEWLEPSKQAQLSKSL